MDLSDVWERHEKRRYFIAMMAGAAAGWPYETRAQQRERVRRVGVLSAEVDDQLLRIAALRQGLTQLGWRIAVSVSTIAGRPLMHRACGTMQPSWST